MIVLLGLFLRLYGLNAEGIWLDEGVSIARGSSNLSGVLSGRVADPSPPFYYLLLHLWMKLFGYSEISARLPSVIFGVLSVLLLYRLGKVFINRKTGRTAALLLAISPLHIYFSGEARMYSLLILLSLISMYCLLAMIRSGRKVFIAGHLTSTLLLLYSHNLGISLVLAQNIFMLFRGRAERKIEKLSWRRWRNLQMIILLFFLPWLIIIFRQFILIQGHYWTEKAAWGSLPGTLLDYSGSRSLLAVFSLLIVIGVARQLSGKTRNGSTTSLTWSWLLTPILFPFLVSVIFTPIYISRITIIALPAFYLLAAEAIFAFRKKSYRVTAGLIVLILNLSVLNGYFGQSHRQPFRQLVRYVDKFARAGDLVFINPPWYRRLLFDYYNRRDDLIIKSRFLPGGAISEENVKIVEGIIRDYPRAWLILCHNRCRPEILQEALADRYELIDQKIFTYHNFQARTRGTCPVYLWQKQLK